MVSQAEDGVGNVVRSRGRENVCRGRVDRRGATGGAGDAFIESMTPRDRWGDFFIESTRRDIIL